MQNEARSPGVVGPLSGKIAPLLRIAQIATAKITAINRPIVVLKGASDMPAPVGARIRFVKLV